MIYDVIIIGGGPAGMMAGIQASEKGASVLLLEKNEKLGKKLYLTGKGRCNITNDNKDIEDFIKKIDDGKFLKPALYNFGVKEVMEFFESRKVYLKTERGNRVFPKSDKSSDVIKVLAKELEKRKVEVKLETEVRSIITKNNKIKEIVLVNDEKLEAKKYIIATGGKSYPSTGSTGDTYQWLKEMGHKVIETRPGLVPIIVKNKWISELEGLSLKNVEIGLFINDKKVASKFGEALFTDKGLSGPIILDLSKKIGEQLGVLKIDFKPALDFKELDKRIQKDFNEFKNKQFKNALDHLLPSKLIPIVVRLSEIDPEREVNSITKEERKTILHLLKEFKLKVQELDNFNKAIVTIGGVDLKEVDSKTMQSKIISNLYLAGEALNIDGPTGGYNLQIAWSTGALAGKC